LTHHPDGVTAVDAEYMRPGLAAVHIIEQSGRAAFVDTGTHHSVPQLLAALETLGLSPEAVDYVFLTHVHLDHAGGAGRLMQALPNALAVVHPRGAPHMVDPAKLIAASIAVYGEPAYRRLYGDLVPIPPERVVAVQDGHTLDLGGRELTLIHTPGHALHHYCIVDIANGVVFTGDTFGLSYREFDSSRGAFIIPTTTPTQFDPEQLINSVRRIRSYSPRAAYLTHYSRVTDIPRLADVLEAEIRELVQIAERSVGMPDEEATIRADMRASWLQLAKLHGSPVTEAQFDELLKLDLDLNAQGLVAWLHRKRK
jgi:glyoxylase-like metal-dependent hydrolase (beta-lactamase superfamily II)